MKNLTIGFMYDHSMFPHYQESYWGHCVCMGGLCTNYCGCNFKRIRLLAPNSLQGICISYCDTYSYDCSSTTVVPYEVDLPTNYYITFPEKFELNQIKVLTANNNKNINNVVPHPYTYSLMPDYKYPEPYIIEDVLLFFSRRSFVVFLDIATGEYKYIWVVDGDQYLIELADVTNLKDVQVYNYFDVKDENTNKIFRFYIENDELKYKDVTDLYPINYKLVEKLIIPKYPMKIDSDYLTTYELHYDSRFDKISFVLFKEKTDIRSYHKNSINVEDPYKNVVQYTYFDDFYENYTVRISMFFNNNKSKGKYPGFKIYDDYQIWRNIQINKDRINQDMPFEDVYCYIIRSDFKIIGRRVINPGDSIEVKKYSDRIVVTVGNLNFFNQAYINGSDYCDVFEDSIHDKSLDYYIVFANLDFYSRFVDLCYNYRFIYCEYNDTRTFNREDVNKNKLNRATLEWRPGIQLQNIKYIDYTRICTELNIDKEIEDNHYMWGVCGYRTKCGGDVWNYVIFIDGDQKPYVSFRTKEDFSIPTIAQILDDYKFNIGIKTFLFNMPFVMYLATFFETFCGDIEFLMWNRPIDLRKLYDEYMKKPPSIYFDNKTHPIFDDKNRIVWENLPETIYKHFVMKFCSPIMPRIGRTDGLYRSSIKQGDNYVELKEWLVYIRGIEYVNKYIYKDSLYSEHTPGKHGNMVLHRQELYYPHRGSCNETDSIIWPDRAEPDVNIYRVDPKDPSNLDTIQVYRPWELGYRINHKCIGDDDSFRIRCSYKLKDGTHPILYTKTEHIISRRYDNSGNKYYLCCINEFYTTDIYTEIWRDIKPNFRYDLIDSTSNPYVLQGYKEIQTKNIIPDKYYNKQIKLIDHVYTSIYQSNSLGRSIPEGDLKDVEKSSVRHEYFPTQYIVHGQWRYIIYFNTLNLENEYIYDILIETVSIYNNNIRYMQARKQAVVDYAVIPLSSFKHYYDLNESPTYCLEYNIKTSYVNLVHANISSILLTFHYNQTAIFNEYYTKGTTHYFSKNKYTQEMPLYPFNYVNTTIAKQL